MDKQKIVLILVIMGIVALIGVVYSYHSAVPAGKSQLTDMAGRSVIVPSEINKTFSLAGSSTVILYMLAPDKMLGWDSRNESENQYVPTKYQNLPVLGGGKNANYESILSQNPDVIFMGHGGDNDTINNIQDKFGGIPVVDVEGDNNLTNIVSAIQFMGKTLGDEEQSTKLVNFYNKVLNQVNSTVATIPDSEKKTVYYAKGDDGLTTFAPGSPQTELINICGGKNVVQSPVQSGGMGVSIELVLQWNPDVIITGDSVFYNSVYSNSLWQNVNAVKNKQVYLVPQSPFSWFENPPGANTIIGIAWTAKVLYPDKFKNMDLKNLTEEFYSDFYHYNLTDTETSNILNYSRLTD
ncbi:iron ABC transporter substrate-binding protein [Methanobacterium paludis]|uniref:ABC-type transporter, periplasmic subunit n=1 Tax=Methanobacterium paludis (strain DSM 25820 / JCM 18151 / SWAN1) TaxID=868131 RepID=F6D7F0_METPW|nr:iron ABC transporter substrate-binding protein [Methanobacterium paludis]AEG17092.1 ABC-type transporter, periplasmic subunit [Methanobacterium paludis]